MDSMIQRREELRDLASRAGDAIRYNRELAARVPIYQQQLFVTIEGLRSIIESNNLDEAQKIAQQAMHDVKIIHDLGKIL